MSTQQTDPTLPASAVTPIRRSRFGALMHRWGLTGEWLVSVALIYIAFILFVAIFGFLCHPYPHTHQHPARARTAAATAAGYTVSPQGLISYSAGVPPA